MASSSIPATKVEKESLTQPNWLELPRDVTSNILQRLNTVDIITRACLVCPLWWNICKDPSMWRTIRVVNVSFNYDLENICRIAVGRSCGGLQDIVIKYFATDDLLEYIAHRAKHLRRMRLVECYRLSYIGLLQAVKKLPLLEEFEISHCNISKHSLEVVGQDCPSHCNISKYSLEVVGQNCPLLKSLKYCKSIDRECNFEYWDERETVSFISKTMSGLHHLQISGNFLTNEDVLAILDGCPLLESLDLRGCYSLYLSDSLEEKCHEQIQDFRPPINWMMYCSDDDDY